MTAVRLVHVYRDVLGYIANVCSAIGAKRVPDLQLIESYCNDNVPKDSDNLTTIE